MSKKCWNLFYFIKFSWWSSSVFFSIIGLSSFTCVHTLPYKYHVGFKADKIQMVHNTKYGSIYNSQGLKDDYPRCSRTNGGIRGNRHKRFVTAGQKWPMTKLSWRLRDPDNLFKKKHDFHVVHSTIRRALAMWAEASDDVLEFHDKTRQNVTSVDIDIFFARFDHGDHEPFDGEGGIVAHSGYPPEGRVHFDASESWTVGGKSGIDFRYVALHEIGHALGLRHSMDEDAIMHPVYKKSFEDLGLSTDDIRGIRYLYRKRRKIDFLDLMLKKYGLNTIDSQLA